jgi:hypothetical protein
LISYDLFVLITCAHQELFNITDNMSSTTPAFHTTFPSPVLTPLGENGTRPTFRSIQLLQSELNANAASVHSDRGTGMHGHLILTMDPTSFATITGGVDFLIPTNPVVPVFAPETPSTTVAAALQQHKDDKQAFKTYHDVDKTLRSLLLAAVPRNYVMALHDPTMGFSLVTTLQLLTHLWINFGKITNEEALANMATLDAPWNPATPIEDLFARATAAVTFAIYARDPLSEITIMRRLFRVINATGKYNLACNAWADTDDAHRSLSLFQAHFRQAEQTHLELAAQSAPSRASPYHDHQANLANQETPTSVGPVRAQVAEAPPVLTYCYTHGFSTNRHHTSATCKWPRADHKKEATGTNMLGGETKVWTEADKKERKPRRLA